MVTRVKCPRSRGRSAGIALYPVHIGDGLFSRLPDGFGEHFGFGVHADGFGDVGCQWGRQLTCAAAQIEQATGAVEPQALDQVVKEDWRIAWPVTRIMPGGAGEQAIVRGRVHLFPLSTAQSRKALRQQRFSDAGPPGHYQVMGAAAATSTANRACDWPTTSARSTAGAGDGASIRSSS